LEAAGFTRRGGTFYRHFTTKDDALTAVVDDHVTQVREVKRIGDLFPLPDRRSELLLLGRLLLAELDNEEAIHRILDKEGDRVDTARHEMAEQVLHRGYRDLVELFSTHLGMRADDQDALVVVLIGGLVNLRRNQWTFGAVPLDIDDDRALNAWVDLAEAALAAPPSTTT
jgi:AcrR family transcriptional regulator